ncbi:Gfo/Idh/MocA family oxidoreductase [Chromohalobacter canadensis]|uniref:Gfo/Idh/MocA family oxidoreductase n=1 Tax=Chromohalobacter canadensis TaxID=141389 RepID=UPI0024102CDD|nr:Gfo/Idh/MocA family oxidoreductase [Chromohalobacter canadensis]
MTAPVRILMVGEGAIAGIHMQALSSVPEARVVAVAGGDAQTTRRFAEHWNIPHVCADYTQALATLKIDAVILATPSPLHADQTEQAIDAGKHVLCEIPMSLNLADAERMTARAREASIVAMVAHTRRFNAPHREMKRRIRAGEFHLQHLVNETYFLRRENLNMQGEPRGWTDHLLWHHACHSVDLFAWLLDDFDLDVWGRRGPVHPELGIAMDMNIGLKSRNETLATLALSFNNHGPFGGFYRYVGEETTLMAYRDELKDYQGEVLPLEGTGFQEQDAEFIASIRECRVPEAAFSHCLPTMRLLDKLEKIMG